MRSARQRLELCVRSYRERASLLTAAIYGVSPAVSTDLTRVGRGEDNYVVYAQWETEFFLQPEETHSPLVRNGSATLGSGALGCTLRFGFKKARDECCGARETLTWQVPVSCVGCVSAPSSHCVTERGTVWAGLKGDSVSK